MKTNFFIAFTAFFWSLNAQYTKMLDFSGANGGSPMSSLISDGTYLYGMAVGGGSNGFGVIFKIKPDGSNYSVLLNFAGVSNGRYPTGSLVYDGTFLCGMTTNGGLGSDGGVLFKIKPDGSNYMKLLDFTGANGKWPYGSLIYDGTFLYGMTNGGGAHLGGLIFKIKPNGSGYTDLMDFTPTTGQWPRGSLISDGTYLYGMTLNNGANNAGAIFKIKPDGTQFSKLLDFAGGSNGRYPYGSLLFDGGFLYGTTSQGGTLDSGIVFKINPDGSGFTKLLDFAGTSNGSFPRSDLISDGTYLYGTTVVGGANQMGVLFKMKMDGSAFTTLCDFAGTSNGRHPAGSLFSDGAFLYGMTTFGGANEAGTIFKYAISPNANLGNYGSADQTILMYPNPVSTQVTIRTTNSFKNATLSIYNTRGQTVKQMKDLSGSEIIIGRDNLPGGVYFVEIEDDRVISRNKMVLME